MFEFLTSGIIGSALGGLFRLAPEVLKFFDKNNDRKHELSMFTLQTEVEKQRGEFKVEERHIDHSVAQLGAIQEAFKEQSETASKSYMWVSALSALVRPMVTYTLFGMYVALKCVTVNFALLAGADWHTVLVGAWTVEDFAMLNMILTFWFVGRSIEKNQK
jgi:hypothetical protein